MHKPRILVVDDEPEVRSVLRRGLEAAQYDVLEAGNAARLFQVFAREPDISLVTLDLALGSEDGLALAPRLRAIRNVPIVMVTARTHPLDRVNGLEQGADDYIVKPFHVREVQLRVQAVLRRYRLEQPGPDAHATRHAFETGVLDPRHRVLTGKDGTEIAMTDAEYDVLALLLRHPGRVLTRDEIMRHLKGRDWMPGDRKIDGVVARLRRKIEPELATPRLIRTVWGVGYVFSGDVEALPSPAG